MMVVEVVTSGPLQIYNISLLFIYLLLARLYSFQIDSNIGHISTHIIVSSVSNVNLDKPSSSASIWPGIQKKD